MIELSNNASMETRVAWMREHGVRRLGQTFVDGTSYVLDLEPVPAIAEKKPPAPPPADVEKTAPTKPKGCACGCSPWNCNGRTPCRKGCPASACRPVPSLPQPPK